MLLPRLLLSVLCYSFCSANVPRPRGVAFFHASLYTPDKDFVCFDGSKTMDFSRVNDDFCDCMDGSDEPGTSACPNGRFYCLNAGHQGKFIPSSFVDDTKCDCCDGSDEYVTPCPNTCDELGRQAREEAQREQIRLKAGREIRAEYVRKGAQLIQEKKEELEAIRRDKIEAEQVKHQREAIKNEAESLESAALEAIRQKKVQEEEEQARKEAEQAFHLFDSNGDGLVDVAELQTRSIFDRDRNGEVNEEEATFYLGGFTSVDLNQFIQTCWTEVKPIMMREAGLFKPPDDQYDINTSTDQSSLPSPVDAPGEDIDESEEELEEHGHGEDEEDDGDDTEDNVDDNQQDSVVSDSEHLGGSESYDEHTRQIIERSRTAREDFHSAEQALRDIDSKINSIEKFLGADFGAQNEFATLQDVCITLENIEYQYKLCFFERATQRPKSGGHEVVLGTWGRWLGESETIPPAKYSVMLYENGQQCWNGPQRSCKVKLRCGSDNILTTATEPNRCEYLFEVETPAACYEELHQDSETNDAHDEL